MKIIDFMKTKAITDEEFIKKFVKRAYIPVTEKYEIAYTIAKICTEEDPNTGLTIENVLFKQVLPLYFVIKNYTNIDVGDEDHVFDFYDLVYENENTPAGQLINDFYQLVPDAYEMTAMADSIIENIIKVNNSVESTVAKLAKNLMNNVPTQEGLSALINQTEKVFNDMNPKKLSGIVDVMTKIAPQAPKTKKEE